MGSAGKPSTLGSAGRLRDSITVEVGSDAQGVVAVVKATAPYANIIEERTGFLTDAAREVLGSNAVREFVRRCHRARGGGKSDRASAVTERRRARDTEAPPGRRRLPPA
jgi:hypothetical protein